MMDHKVHDLTKNNEISNDDTKTTSYPINNLEESTSQSYGSLSYYSRTVQVTNNPLMNQFFNGSTFY
ncbi:hypothetical protein C1646_679056 [Rhizophagus diaphanus]|nr:hypothetical protein C1646_679056 [Rhizophagus diaphanus] [Rhizophagus sp. MUCL 43196]